MHFQLNSNGNSAEDMRNQFFKLHDQAQNLLDVLQEMDVFHGRNYQTVPELDRDIFREDDLAEYRRMQQHANALREFAMEGAARVIRQREGL